MLDFLFKKPEIVEDFDLNEIYSKLKEHYNFEAISQERKDYLGGLILKYGYLPYSQEKALRELSPAEVLFGLEIKWQGKGIFKENKFNITSDKISPLKRMGIKNTDWIKKEGHDIKLINLAALGDGNTTEDAGKFIDWLRQLLILPVGNLDLGILNTTIYLIPFHPREFGCAYLPTSSDVSENLEDKSLSVELGLNAKSQVKLFIKLAQLAGHPVIYDVLPQTGRFAKIVLAKPYIARWFDINELLEKIENCIDTIAQKLEEKFDKEDIEIVKDIFKQTLRSGGGDLSEYYQRIFDAFFEELSLLKKDFSNQMLEQKNQEKIVQKVKEIIAEIENVKSNKELEEYNITKQGEITQKLISKGLWPAPGGAWCSAGVPVFDKMSECGSYPMFTHYDFEGNDVTPFANLDCQTPYFFTFLENGKYNDKVVKFFVQSLKTIKKEYNFDGFRIDHIDHVIDEVSTKDGLPISYRIPKYVLNLLNTELKKETPYFATLAEYMLWEGFLKEYHEDMNFDLLWGNDIICQSQKTPEKIIEDNQDLANYNTKNFKIENLSVLKTYNNQDGEFRVIDQYPGQLGENGALFKWFKYKFLVGGKYAQRPVMYVDGDESFTKTGIEATIGAEISMQRENNEQFFKKFDAINRFVKSQDIIINGEASIIKQDDDGFVSWIITKDPLKQAILVVANYAYPTEKIIKQNDDGTTSSSLKEGNDIYEKTVFLPSEYAVKTEIYFDGEDMIEKDFETTENELYFDKLEASEFRIFRLKK